MLAHALLDAAELLPRARLTDLLGDGGAVIIAPHADDESLGCGALIARAVDEGRPVRIVVVSDGTGSHPASRAYPPERLKNLRESEALAAAWELGICPSHVVFLQLPDRFVPAEGFEATRAAAIIAERARQARASALFVTWRHDPHCDHRACYAIARQAQRRAKNLRLYEYSIWGRDLPRDCETSGAPGGWRLDASAVRERKMAAIACHRSQVTGLIDDDPNGFQLSADHIARQVFEDETFMEISP